MCAHKTIKNNILFKIWTSVVPSFMHKLVKGYRKMPQFHLLFSVYSDKLLPLDRADVPRSRLTDSYYSSVTFSCNTPSHIHPLSVILFSQSPTFCHNCSSSLLLMQVPCCLTHKFEMTVSSIYLCGHKVETGDHNAQEMVIY